MIRQPTPQMRQRHIGTNSLQTSLLTLEHWLGDKSENLQAIPYALASIQRIDQQPHADDLFDSMSRKSVDGVTELIALADLKPANMSIQRNLTSTMMFTKNDMTSLFSPIFYNKYAVPHTKVTRRTQEQELDVKNSGHIKEEQSGRRLKWQKPSLALRCNRGINLGTDKTIRQRILEAALQIMQETGIKKLTQPKVAQAAGIRQSHLTYYFPKKMDLVIALLQEHNEITAKKLESTKKKASSDDIGTAMETLVSDRQRMRFFLGLIIEADEDQKLKKLMDVHVRQFNALVAEYFGRAADDFDVESFLNALRGFGMENLLRTGKPRDIDVQALAKKFKLKRKNA